MSTILLVLIWLLGTATCLVVMVATFAWITSFRSDAKPLLEFLDERADARELIVIVHGYVGSAKTMRPVKVAIAEVRPNADILQFQYSAQIFSNANLFSLASQMDERIEARQLSKNYSRITLCGYSAGALLIRKAYVYGRGSIADAPIMGGSDVMKGPVKSWTRSVDRFVLLAGMNRGWQRNTRKNRAPYYKCLMHSVALFIGRLTRTGYLVRRCEKGEPFVANLRLQWLQVTRGNEEGRKPAVVQLLGDSDDVVHAGDSNDVAVSRDFTWVVVHNTNHKTVVRLGNDGPGLERKQKIQLAFGDEDALVRLKQMSPVPKLMEDGNIESVVFVLHGIRDMGNWTSQFEKPLQDAFKDCHSGASKLHIHRAGYSYFGMFSFLLWADRQENVRWFMDQVTELTARFPRLTPENLHFIGHSYGTYILASALDKYATLRVGRAALAGSVIRRDFGWTKLSESRRIGQLRNYVAESDWVVGLLPRVFEIPGFGRFNGDLGSAGFNGFEDNFAGEMETRFIRGAHGAALHKDNISSIVAFVTRGERVDVPELLVSEHPKMLAFFSNICWILWFLAACLLAIGAWKVPLLVHMLSSAATVPSEAAAWCSRVAYFALIWLVLKTV